MQIGCTDLRYFCISVWEGGLLVINVQIQMKDYGYVYDRHDPE